MSVSHIPKPQHPDRFQAWCGKRLGVEFALAGLDHAAGCVITGSLVQPCKRCVAAAVAILTGQKKYEPDERAKGEPT